MNGFDYNKMAENFKADERLKMSVKNHAAGHNHVKFKLTKREKAMRYSSVAALVAYLLILCLILDVGETVRITTNTLKGKVPGAAPYVQTTSQSAGSKSSNGNADKTEQLQENTSAAQGEIVQNQEALKSEQQNSSVQNLKTDGLTTDKVTTDKTTTEKVDADVITSFDYTCTNSTETVKVNKLTDKSPYSYYEFNTSKLNGYSIKTIAIDKMFDSDLVVTKEKNGAITYTNSNQKIMLVDKIISYPKTAGETDSVYVKRSIEHIKTVFSDDAGFKTETGFGEEYSLGKLTNENIKENESLWGAVIKSSYSGDKFGSTKTIVYLHIIFDKSQESYAVQMFTISTEYTGQLGTMFAEAVSYTHLRRRRCYKVS